MCIQIISIPQDVIDEIIQEIETNRAINFLPDWPACPQCAFPKSEVGLVVPEGGRLVSAAKKWGHKVPWSKQPVANTRNDTAMNPDKMWWKSIQKRRCIIPTFGFFEPHKTELTVSPKTGKPIKQQYFFETKGSPVTFIAGIYKDDRFSLMTTEPNATMASMHNRMPIVLLPDEIDTWLTGDFTSLFNRSKIEITTKRV